MIRYRANGMVLGYFWGGGQGSYPAKTLTAETLPELEKQINDGIDDGSLDSGAGFEALIGAAMDIETIDTRIIDCKTFTAIESNVNFYGDLDEKQQDWLDHALDCQL